ncbi:MAG: hypothetical protein IKX58_04030 [Clostridia bacterium]|nr:hypothetical protein [Clostridia bacterium]
MKKVLVSLLIALMITALFANPIRAEEESVSVILPIKQTVVNEGDGTGEAEAEYMLTAITSDAPMPEGSENGIFTFRLVGEQEYNIPEIRFSEPGTWEYLLKAEGSKVSPDSVTIKVVITEENGVLKATVVSMLPDGDKCDLEFVVEAGGEPEPTDEPKPTDQPGPTETPRPTGQPTPTDEPSPRPPKTGGPESWSVVNLICALLTVCICVRMFVSNRQDSSKSKLSIVPALISVAVFLMFENTRVPMKAINGMTPAMLSLLIVNILLELSTKFSSEKDTTRVD